jgi:hypothetical protein
MKYKKGEEGKKRSGRTRRKGLMSRRRRKTRRKIGKGRD